MVIKERNYYCVITIDTVNHLVGDSHVANAGARNESGHVGCLTAMTLI